MKRCFISIDIPENVKNEIVKIQNQLPDFVGRKTELENLHLTLKFLGEIDDEKIEEVRKRLREIDFEKFEVGVESIGVFSEKFVRIVWLHLTNCDGLQKEVDESLEGLFSREQRFMSHLTIARVKNVGDKKHFLDELKRIEIPRLSFEVDRFYLKKSVLKREGAVYNDIGVYSLV